MSRCDTRERRKRAIERRLRYDERMRSRVLRTRLCSLFGEQLSDGRERRSVRKHPSNVEQTELLRSPDPVAHLHTVLPHMPLCSQANTNSARRLFDHCRSCARTWKTTSTSRRSRTLWSSLRCVSRPVPSTGPFVGPS